MFPELAHASFYLFQEYGPVSTSKLTTACNNLVKGEFSFAFKQQDYPYRMAHIYECEFILLEMMVRSQTVGMEIAFLSFKIFKMPSNYELGVVDKMVICQVEAQLLS